MKSAGMKGCPPQKCGSCPRTIKTETATNPPIIEEPEPDQGKEDGQQQQGDEGGREKDGDKGGLTWVMGADEEDNKIYKKFLSYCEERREDLRLIIEADEDRMKDARRKEATWELLRTSISFLKEKFGGGFGGAER